MFKISSLSKKEQPKLIRPSFIENFEIKEEVNNARQPVLEKQVEYVAPLVITPPSNYYVQRKFAKSTLIGVFSEKWTNVKEIKFVALGHGSIRVYQPEHGYYKIISIDSNGYMTISVGDIKYFTHELLFIEAVLEKKASISISTIRVEYE